MRTATGFSARWAAQRSAAEITERAGHVLAEVSNGLGIIVSPPLGKTVLEHVRMWLLPDGRVVVVLISPGGNTRDKIVAAAAGLSRRWSWTPPRIS